MDKRKMQAFIEESVNDFIKKEGLRPESVIVKINRGESKDGAIRGDLLCSICGGIIAYYICKLIDGVVKCVWEHVNHNCSGPSTPPENPDPIPQTCPLCHEQLVPGKPHYCK